MILLCRCSRVNNGLVEWLNTWSIRRLFRALSNFLWGKPLYFKWELITEANQTIISSLLCFLFKVLAVTEKYDALGRKTFADSFIHLTEKLNTKSTTVIKMFLKVDGNFFLFCPLQYATDLLTNYAITNWQN